MQSQSLGFASFLSQTDAVGKTILVVLVLMSVLTWMIVITRAIQHVRTHRHSARFLKTFWNAPSLEAVHRHLDAHPSSEPFGNLARNGMTAMRHYSGHATNKLDEADKRAALLTRAMRRALDELGARREAGLAVLASVGSTAPFVGLFGTVWGVYHALVAIGVSGQGTLDKVAGPVGEALLMTALGLAVAIPAVLAYNTLVRANRVLAARLDAFAHDLFACLTTGERDGAAAMVTPFAVARGA